MQPVTTVCDTPIGALTLASDGTGTGLAGAWLAGQKYFGAGLGTNPAVDDTLPLFAAARAWLAVYFSGEMPGRVPFPLAPAGSDFRRRVWRILQEIPYGTLLTYGEIARRIGCGSARAVGAAVGRNPLSVFIPCHRVIGADGALTGYAGGLEAKRALLALEGGSLNPGTPPSTAPALLVKPNAGRRH